MNRILPAVLFCILCGFAQCSSDNKGKVPGIKNANMELPQGWGKAGSHPSSYNMGLDPKAGTGKDKCATIASTEEVKDGFGTLMSGMRADSFRGKRVRMTGYMKSDDVKEWAGFWMRIDCKNERQGEFDNMQSRAVKGKTDWKKYEIVLNIDTGATHIAYGALVAGTGQVWFEKVSFEIVGNDVPSTDMTAGSGGL